MASVCHSKRLFLRLRYPGKGLADISYSMALNAPIEATVYGTQGTVKVSTAHLASAARLSTSVMGPGSLEEIPVPDFV